MPSYGEKQQPAGYAKPCGCGKPAGVRSMVSSNKNIDTGLSIDSPEYKGNAVLNAQKL